MIELSKPVCNRTLNAFVRAVNKIDDHFEYRYKSAYDRLVVQVILNELHTELFIISKETERLVKELAEKENERLP